MTASTAMPGLEQLLPALIDAVRPQAPAPLDDVAAAAELAEAEVRELVDLGVITLKGDATVDFRDAAIVAVWGRLRAAGFTDERGYGSATLALYVETMGWLAREEVGRFLSRVSGCLNTQQAAELGAEGVRLGNELIALLRTRAIFETLAETTQ